MEELQGNLGLCACTVPVTPLQFVSQKTETVQAMLFKLEHLGFKAWHSGWGKEQQAALLAMLPYAGSCLRWKWPEGKHVSNLRLVETRRKG